MRKLLSCIIFAACITFIACGLTACVPEKTVQWSSDGKQAVVRSGGSLYLCDDQGNLSNPIAEGVEHAAWLPDSSHLILVCKHELSTWNDLVTTAPIGFDEKKIIDAAMTAKNEFLSYTGELENFRPSNSGLLTPGQWLAASFYLHLQGDPHLKEKMGDEWKELEKVKAEIRTVRVVQASTGPIENSPTLFTVLDEIQEIRVAPDGEAVAFVTNPSEVLGSGHASLFVHAVRAGVKPVLVADHVSTFPDWSPDSRDLVYIQGTAADEIKAQLGHISRRTVRNARGTLLQNPSKAEDLATVIFQNTLKVRCCPDGRIIFSAAEYVLPSINNQISNRLTLFSIYPGQMDAVTGILPRSTDKNLPNRVDLFEISPDGKYAAVPGNQGRVSIVTLAKGEVTAIINEKSTKDLLTIPVWRNSRQLCLVAPPKSGYTSSNRAEIILWSEDQSIVLSKSWPDKVLENLQ